MKRVALRLLMFLLAGAIINVAVAWGCALWIVPWPSNFQRASEQSRSFSDDVEYGSLNVWQTRRAGALNIHVLRHRGATAGTNDGSALRLIPEWTGLREPSDAFKAAAASRSPFGVQVEETILEARGWPMTSMWVSHVFQAPGPFMTYHGMKTPWMRKGKDLLNGNMAYPLAMPLQPVWPGFVTNSVVYALVAAVCWKGATTMQRRIRIKRGQCAACGYSLRGISGGKCPECGAAAV